mgnify:CR=1 FL=1
MKFKFSGETYNTFENGEVLELYIMQVEQGLLVFDENDKSRSAGYDDVYSFLEDWEVVRQEE